MKYLISIKIWIFILFLAGFMNCIAQKAENRKSGLMEGNETSCAFELHVDSSLNNAEYRLVAYSIKGIKSIKEVNRTYENWHFKAGNMMKIDKQSFEEYVTGICVTKKYRLAKVQVIPDNAYEGGMRLLFYFDSRKNKF